MRVLVIVALLLTVVIGTGQAWDSLPDVDGGCQWEHSKWSSEDAAGSLDAMLRVPDGCMKSPNSIDTLVALRYGEAQEILCPYLSVERVRHIIDDGWELYGLQAQGKACHGECVLGRDFIKKLKEAGVEVGDPQYYSPYGEEVAPTSCVGVGNHPLVIHFRRVKALN